MAVSHGLVLAMIVVILGGAAYVLLARTLDHAATADVLAAARAEADRIAETNRLTPPSDSDTPSASAVRVAVVLPDGSFAGEGRAEPVWLRPRPAEVATIRALGEDVRLATIPAVSGGVRVGTVVAGRSLEAEDRLLRRLRLLLWAGGLAAVAVSMAAGWILAGRATRPVRRAYEAQASFAADASHEFRSPLAFVRSGVEVLAEHEPELGDEVLHEVDYLTGLTERLLTLARAQSGSLAFQLKPVRLEPLCRTAVQRNRSVHGMRIDLRIDGDPIAAADAIATEAILDAVLENVAAHAGGTALVSCRAQAGVVRIDVADSGPGLTDEELAHAFERFYRADPVRAHENGGAGLGLALARSLAEAQRGRIWLERTPGGGLTAVLQLRRDGVGA